MITHEGQDSDFLPHFVGDNPLPYYLAKCPHCSFIAYPDDFSQENRQNITITSLQIKKILSLPLLKKLPDGASDFFIAGKIYEELKKNPYFTGNLYLRGGWCCRLVENRKAEIEFQQLAIRFFKLSLEKSTISNPDSVLVVTYLIGELYRRLEDRKQAREWFETTAESIIDPEQQWLLELTQKQAELNEYLIN
jgi:uncharacterized protein (DUF2225 family)